MSFSCSYEDYQGLMDIGDILLVGEEKVYAFLDKIFAACAEYYSARTINIGMDEAFMLGLGRYCSLHGYEDKTEIMLKHIKRVSEIAQKYGFECEMWSDMFFGIANGNSGGSYDDEANYERARELLPENVTLCYWDYVTSDYGKCAEKIEKHLRITNKVAFTGAIWEFMGFAPDNRFSISIADNAVNACRDKGIKHFQISLWADTHGECSLFSSLPSLFYYAEKARGESVIDKKKFFEITGEEFDTLMSVDDLNDPRKIRYTTLNNKSFYYLYQDVFLGEFDSMLSDGINEAYKNIAEEMQERVKGKYGYIFKTLAALAKCLSIKAELGKKIRVAYENDDRKGLKDLSDDMEKLIPITDELKDAFYSQWEIESKPFGLEIHSARLATLKERISYAKRQIDRYLSGELKRIDELEEKKMPYGRLKSAKEDDYMYTDWQSIISVN
ncbi:MAG: hypothetical protein IJS67_00415, partial [Clostridia bacterium]|nr:hypothetical protein [Clostridia bacterium]